MKTPINETESNPLTDDLKPKKEKKKHKNKITAFFYNLTHRKSAKKSKVKEIKNGTNNGSSGKNNVDVDFGVEITPTLGLF